MRGLCYLLLPLHCLEITKLKFDFCGPWNIHWSLKWMASCILVGNELLFLPWSSRSSHLLWDSCISFDLLGRVTRAFEITKCTANWKIITNQKQLNLTKKVFELTLEFYIFYYQHLAIFFFFFLQAIVFRPFKGEVLDAVVTQVNKVC